MLDALLADLSILGSVVLIDIVLAGDNALVVGMAAAGLSPGQRRRAIAVGIGIALLCRVLFALIAIQLLAIIGLTLAGGLLLLWVAWKMWRELRAQQPAPAVAGPAPESEAPLAPFAPPAKSFGAAIWQIAVADISMSLDNVLAVAGAARDHMVIMVFGLLLSIALMGVAASLIANFLQRHHWLSYLGLAVIAYVAIEMIYRGTTEVATRLGVI